MARIVIVDDDEIVAEIAADILTDAGHMVSAVHDGADALSAVIAAQADLVILDYELPGKTGMQILREVRDRPGGGAVPVMMLTATTGRLLQGRALRDGVDDYLLKPFTPDALLERTEALLASARAAGLRRTG